MLRPLALALTCLAPALVPAAQSLPPWAEPAGETPAAAGGPCGPLPCPPPPPPPVPVDGGLGLLALAGCALAGQRLRRRRGAAKLGPTRVRHSASPPAP